jgi:hypothetical protein
MQQRTADQSPPDTCILEHVHPALVVGPEPATQNNSKGNSESSSTIFAQLTKSSARITNHEKSPGIIQIHVPAIQSPMFSYQQSIDQSINQSIIITNTCSACSTLWRAPRNPQPRGSFHPSIQDAADEPPPLSATHKGREKSELCRA